MDRTVVVEECIRDRRQPLPRVDVVVRDRLVGHVAAREHDRFAELVQQQVVQGCVGEHDAEPLRSGRHRRRDRGVDAPAQQHDRPAVIGEQRRLDAVEVGQRAGGVEVGRHQRERLLLAVLAGAQGVDGRLVAREGREVVATESLHRHHGTRAHGRGGAGDRVTDRLAAVGGAEAQPGPARSAADGLRVEPSVGRVVVLARARVAHGEAGHRGARAVVGNVAHDREPRPAVRAVEERVAVPTVGGIEELTETVVAGCRVCGHERASRPAGIARDDGEVGVTARGQARRVQLVDRGERGQVGFDLGDKALDRVGRPLDLDEHAALVVADEAGECVPVRHVVHERAEADPLHDAADLHPHAYRRRSGRSPLASGVGHAASVIPPKRSA